MSQHGITCKLDGSIKSPGDCYFGACSNEQYFECFPAKESRSGIAKPVKTYDPPKQNR